MKKFAKILTFLLLIFCGVVFASCGKGVVTPTITASDTNVELIIGTDESKTIDVVLSDYGNGSDSVKVESYEQDKIISLSYKKIGDGKTKVTIAPLYPGKATIKVSSITYTAKPIEISVNVILPVGDIEINEKLENQIYVIKGNSVNFENLDLIKYIAIDTGIESLEGVATNQIGVNYTLENVLTTDGVAIENGKLLVDENCVLDEVEIRATSIYNAEISKTFKVKILNPISSSVWIDGNKVLENGSLTNGEGNSYAFELYPRESDVTINKKDIIISVKAGLESDSVKIEKIYDENKYSVDLKSINYKNGYFEFVYTISGLNAGYLDNVSFKISYKDYSLGEGNEDYFVQSGNLTVSTYNIPNSVLINGNASSESGLDVLIFENVANISKGTLLEFALSPSNLAPEYSKIILWAENYVDMPISFYRLNSTRTSYELVFGYPRDVKDGDKFVCTGVDNNGNAYFEMEVGTKLYVVKNQKYNKDTNVNAVLFTQSSNLYALNSERSKTQLNFKVNPGASSVDQANYDGTNFTINNSNLILSEFVDSLDIYLAIAPENFDIGTTSIVKLKNSNIADVSELKVVSSDDNFLYVKFTLTPKTLGATKLTVYLCDGFEKEFDLKIISTLEDIDIKISDTTENILDYNESLTGKINDTDENSVKVQKLAFKAGMSVQLEKIANPITAEYILEYSFAEIAIDKAISELTISEILNGANFNADSNILNVVVLKNYSIIQAKTSQSEGKTLIKVDVKGRKADGDGYEENASHTFYFLVEIYKGIEGFEISNNIHEIYSYETVGDRNIDKSTTQFSVTLSSKYGIPTYINSLELYIGTSLDQKIEFGENNKAYIKNNENENILVITKQLDGNTWNFTLQAITSDIQDYIFFVKLTEIDQSKTIGGIVRVIVKDAVEITDIEIVNVDINEGIYIENNTLTPNEQGPIFEIKYNIYTKDGSEPLNSGLEFELSSNLTNLKVTIDNEGKITVPAGVGGTGRVLIYPSSNYFASSNGMKNGDEPFVEISITIANGESEETAIRIDTQDKIKYLKQNPTKHYLLVGDFSISETIEEFSGGLYGRYNDKIATLTLTNTMFVKLTGIVKNINIIGEINTQNANLGAICDENYGKIENVNASGLKISNTEAGSHTGALVGANYGEITGGEIVATLNGVNVGGVAGVNGTKIENEITFTGKIENVTFAGNITASGNAGGIVAENNGEISNCKVEKWSNNSSTFITATSDATAYIGSIAGVSSGKISQTYAYSYNDTMYDITAGTNNNVLIGGLVGQVSGGTITECMTNFSLEGTKIGALIGEITNGTVQNSYTLSKVSSSSASALAISGADKISYSYSRAYYVDAGVNKYLTQTGSANVYCAGSYTSLADFNLALQNNLSNIDSLKNIWATDTESNGVENKINQGAAYLINANPPKAVSSIEINVNSDSKAEFLYSQESGVTNIVLYYYKLLEELDDDVAKTSLANKNLISLANILTNDNLLFSIVTSSSISFVGNNIKILNVGKTEVKVTSKYATTTCQEQTIVFYVIYPIQDFNLYRGSSSLNPSTIVKDGDVDQVGMSKTETYSSKVKSTVLLNGQNYSIFTNLFAIGFEIKANNNASNVLGGISSIYQNSSSNFDDNYKFVAEGTYTITPKNYTFATNEEEKFSINSILVLQNNGIGTYLGNIEGTDFDVINKLIAEKFNRNYQIDVTRGASRIETTLTDSELSPSNVLNFDIVAISDKNEENIIIDIYEGDEIVGSSDTSKTIKNQIFDITVAKSTTTDNRHYFNAYVSVKSDVRKDITTVREFKIKIYDEDNKVVSVLNLKLIPQEVISVSHAHYAAETNNLNGFAINNEPTPVLRPGKNGLLAINLYPNYAAYEKIEIESAIINENYYVLFEQMKSADGQNFVTAGGTIGYASERDVNKLTIYNSPQLMQDNGWIYIRTKIVENVPDGVYFPIIIKVYPADSNKEVKISTFVLASESIDKAEISFNGEKEAVINRGSSIDFEITVKEDQELTDISIINYDPNSEDQYDYINKIWNPTEYEIKDGKKIYSGKLNVGLNAALYEDGVVKIQTIMRRWINGKLEEEFDEVKLSVVDFIVKGVYIEGNTEDDNVFVAPIQLRQDLTFGFILSDTPSYGSLNENTAIERIKQNKQFFLDNIALNIEYSSNQTSEAYKYSYSINKDIIKFNPNSNENENNNSNESEEKKYYSQEVLNSEFANLAYNLYYANSNSKYFDENGVENTNNYFSLIIDRDENGKPLSSRTFAINGLRSGNIPMQIKIGYTLPGINNVTKYITYDFIIKVQIYEDEDTPIAIKDEEEFIRYMNATTTETGEPANYILMNDLYFTDFTPIANTDLIASLDGNNKIITIRNFNISSLLNNNQNQTLNLALFQNVSENTILKNITINLYELQDIVVDEEKVSTVNVAGLFIENSGIIYNCEITALNLFKTYNTDILINNGIISTSETNYLDKGYKSASYSDGNGIRVYFDAENIAKIKKDSTTVQIAGLGITNYSTGRISNCRVGNTSFTKVFMTDIDRNQSTDYQISASHLTLLGQADIAGVIITNSGVIASSFFSNGFITNLAVSGTASKTAGFAIYNEYGAIITGSYAKSFKKVNEQNSMFYRDGGIYSEGIAAGFVYENSAEITDCYANLLMGGNLSGRIVSGFVYSNKATAVIERCYSAATITGQLTTRMPFSGNNAKGDSMQLGTLSNCYYYVLNYDTESLIEEKYSTGAYAILASTVGNDLLYGFAYTSDSTSLNGSKIDGVWTYNGEIDLTSANKIAISVRYLVDNYNGVEGARRYPYVSKYAYGSENNPIIIRTADEFNRVFGQETGLKENAYYAISQYYNKSLGIVFGNYRLVSHIDFNNIQNVASIKISSSIMTLTGKSNVGGLFDGNGLTISNVEIALSEHMSVGLFSQIINGAVFKNVNLTVKQVSAGNGVYVGGVAGRVVSASLINIDLKATTLKGDNRSEINGLNVVGGIAGLVEASSKLSNLSASISVISNYHGGDDFKRGQDCSNTSYVGGVVGIVDIYKQAGESSVSVSNAQVNKLNVSGASIIIEGYNVGGVIGYVGKSTKVSDVRFEISGDSNFEQKLNSTGETIGGIVGINWGDLSEIRIEHNENVQKIIEDSVAGYNKSGSVKYGHTSLFSDAKTTFDTPVQYVGGLVGQMKNGNLINSYSKVDVVLSSADFAGGLIGYNQSNGRFDQIYALGDVDGKIAGGIIGKNDGYATISHIVAINFYSKENSNLNIIQQVNAISLEGKTIVRQTIGENEQSKTIYTITEPLDNNIQVVYNFSTEENANALKIVQEETTYYLTSIEVKRGSDTIISSPTLDSNGKITSATINSVGSLVGQSNSNLRIGNEVYSNKEFTFNNVIIKLKDEATINPLIISLDDYNGVAQHGTLLNRMFLSARDAWDVNMWAKDSDDMLPYLTFGVVTKVLYIEKPNDFMRLWKYSGEGYVVIIGDDPATAFNPYKYINDDTSTYGEFTSEQLKGLSVEDGNLYFNLSYISNSFLPADFKGTLYGENSGIEYFISGLNSPLFKNVSDAVVRNIAFGKTEDNIEERNTPVFAEEISSSSLVTDIIVQNIKITTSQNGDVGAFTNTINGINEIKDITFTNIQLTVNASNAANIGLLAGQLTNSGSSYTIVDNFKIEGPSSITIDGTASELINIGGFIGLSNGTLTFNKIETANLKIDFSGLTITGKVQAGLLLGQAQTLTFKASSSSSQQKDINFNGTITNVNGGAVIGYIGGVVGNANNTTTTIDGLNTNVAINVKIKSESDITSSVGGVIGYGNATIEHNEEVAGLENKIKNNIKVTGEGDIAIAVGGIIGSLQESFTTNSNVLVDEAGSDNSTEVTGTIVNLGGVIGFVNDNSVTIDGTLHVNSKLVANGKTLNVGGFIGFIGNIENLTNSVTIGSGSQQNLTFNADIEATANAASATLKLGGIVGYANNGTKSTITIGQCGFKGGAIYVKNENVENSNSTISTLYVGGIVGDLCNSTISGAYVSGHIQVEKSASEISVGGVAGYVAGTSTISSTKSWGNIKLNKGLTITNLHIGGVIGQIIGSNVTFSSNSTLTSIYNLNLGSANQTNGIHALIGSGTAKTQSGNTFSHMYNLAIDEIGTNNHDANAFKNNFITTNFDYLGDSIGDAGSKLNPSAITNSNFGTKSDINSVDVKEIKYYIASVNITSISGKIVYADAHLIGNGKNWITTTNTNTTTFTNIYGYVSGFKFVTYSQYTLTSGNLLNDKAPSGVVNVNDGLLYANSVVVYGIPSASSFDESDFKYSINAGVTGTNNGLIADTGAILYVKNALAGFVSNNTGVIINSYVNGVVQNGAMYSFNGGASGKVYNCYTSVRHSGAVSSNSKPIFNGTLSGNYYDRQGTEVSKSENGIEEKTTSAMSTTNSTTNTNYNGAGIKSYQYNFGYQYLNYGTYFQIGTGYQVPNVGRLELLSKINVFSMTILTNLDYDLADITSHNQISQSNDNKLGEHITFEGNNFEINNIPGNSEGGFFDELNGKRERYMVIQNIEFNYKIGATVGKKSTSSAVLVNVGAVVNDANWVQLINVRSSGATVNGEVIGGLVGKMEVGSIKQSFNFNDVDGEEAGGGLVGDASQVYFGGDQVTDRVGNYGNVYISVPDRVTSFNSAFAGGIVGAAESCSIKYAFNIGNIWAEIACSGIVGISANSQYMYIYNYGGKFSGEDYSSSNYYSLAFIDICGGFIDENANNKNTVTNYADYLIGTQTINGTTCLGTSGDSTALEWGTRVTSAPNGFDVNNIDSAQDLAWVAYDINNNGLQSDYWTKDLKLTADIDLTGYIWNPIDIKVGSFDGQGHTIKGMGAYHDEHSGLFGNILTYPDNTVYNELKNVKIVNAVVQSKKYAATLGYAENIYTNNDANGYIVINNNIIINSRVYSADSLNKEAILACTSSSKVVAVGNVYNCNATRVLSNVASNDGDSFSLTLHKYDGYYKAGIWYSETISNPYKITLNGSSCFKNNNLSNANFYKLGDKYYIQAGNTIYDYNLVEKTAVYYYAQSLGVFGERQHKQTEKRLTFNCNLSKKYDVAAAKSYYNWSTIKYLTDYSKEDFNSKYLNSSSWSSNGSDVVSAIDIPNKEYEFEQIVAGSLEIYDGGTLVTTLPYSKNSSYKLYDYISSKVNISGKYIAGFESQLTNTYGEPQFSCDAEDSVSYDNIKNLLSDKRVAKLNIVWGLEEQAIAYYVGSTSNYEALYTFTNNNGTIALKDNSNNATALYTPTNGTGYWVNNNGNRIKFENSKFYYSENLENPSWVEITSSDEGYSEPFQELFFIGTCDSGTYNLSTYFATITIDYNGGTGTPSSETIIKGREYTLPNAPTAPNEDTVFDGWKVGDSTELKQPGTLIVVSKNTTITAQWKDKEYKVVFEKGDDNASGSMNDVTTTKDYTLPENGFTAPYGKEFDCWLIGKTEILAGSTINIKDSLEEGSETLTIKAQWRDIEHTANIYIDAGQSVTLANGESTMTISDEKLGEVTITRDENVVTISFKYTLNNTAGDSNYNKSERRVIDSGKINTWLAGNVLVGENSLTLDSNITYVVLDKYTSEIVGANVGSAITEIPAGKTGNLDLATYGTISGEEIGEGNYFNTISFTHNKNVVYSLKFWKGYTVEESDIPVSLTRFGYNFVGYGEDGTTTRAAIANSINSGTESFAVKFDAIKQNISFDGNGASGSMASVEFSIEMPYTISENQFVRNGYKFIGFKDQNGKTWNVGDTIRYGNGSSEFTTDVVLTAQWEQIKLTIKFSAGEGSLPDGAQNPQEQVLTWGESITMPANPYESSWYKEFKGWTYGTTTYSAGETYAFDITLTDNATYTFVATWADKDLTIVLDKGADKATGTMENNTIKYSANSGLYTMPGCNFIRTGYAFSGWLAKYTYQDTDGTLISIQKTFNAGENVSIDSLFANLNGLEITYSDTITITATWTAEYNFKIVFNANSSTITDAELNTYNPQSATYSSDALENGTTITKPGFIDNSGKYEIVGYSLISGATTESFNNVIDFATFFTLNENGDIICKDGVSYDENTKTFTLTLYCVWGEKTV